jgi:hypothetical protein
LPQKVLVNVKYLPVFVNNFRELNGINPHPIAECITKTNGMHAGKCTAGRLPPFFVQRWTCLLAEDCQKDLLRSLGGVSADRALHGGTETDNSCLPDTGRSGTLKTLA